MAINYVKSILATLSDASKAAYTLKQVSEGDKIVLCILNELDAVLELLTSKASPLNPDESNEVAQGIHDIQKVLGGSSPGASFNIYLFQTSAVGMISSLAALPEASFQSDDKYELGIKQVWDSFYTLYNENASPTDAATNYSKVVFSNGMATILANMQGDVQSFGASCANPQPSSGNGSLGTDGGSTTFC